MRWRFAVLGVLGFAVVAAGGFAAWMFTLPPAPAAAAAPAIAPEEYAATLAALQPPKRERPLVAIIGINDATETTDYMMPYGILKRADVADVVALATGPGPVQLYPALKVEPDATIAEFDTTHPDGADYVIVPAMSRNDDPVALAWIRQQADKGAIVIGVCVGALVVGEAGLLDGRKGTTHWYYLSQLREQSPAMNYVPDRRMVIDGRVATTTGISASMPSMLTLIEAIAGKEKAQTVAEDLGKDAWDLRHASAAFKFSRPFAGTVLGNVMSFWNREEFGIELKPGMDEVTLALVADVWSRTYRSQALSFAASGDAVASRSGLRILPDVVASERDGLQAIELDRRPPSQALDAALAAIEQRYGDRTASVVSMQLEYPR